MSGHSKWHSIRHKKGVADAARGKVFTRHANLITIAARSGGGDPEMNPALRLEIEKAKAVNMPGSNIERAIQRGTGEDKAGAQFFETQYEGYGPEGIALIVKALTDNKNRTVANVRSIFSKHGGHLGETGCVGWMFHKKGILLVSPAPDKKDETQLAAIDAGAEDVQEEGSNLEVTTAAADLFHVQAELEKTGVKILHSEITLIPENTIKIDDRNKAEAVLNLIDTLEEEDDVSSVSANFDIPESILKQIS